MEYRKWRWRRATQSAEFSVTFAGEATGTRRYPLRDPLAAVLGEKAKPCRQPGPWAPTGTVPLQYRVDSGRGQDRTLIGRQGEIRDRSSEGQHYRMAGLNLLAAIVIYWNTAHLGEAVRQRKHAGLTVEPELLAHISPLGWAHILLTGEYRWPKRR